MDPVLVGECNWEINAIQGQNVEEDDMEANQAPQEYPPNPSVWRKSADHQRHLSPKEECRGSPREVETLLGR